MPGLFVAPEGLPLRGQREGVERGLLWAANKLSMLIHRDQKSCVWFRNGSS